MTTIHIQEASYIDPRAGNDKFYRTFVTGSSWITQYGRNGTIGTFTKLTETASEEAATKAANAKFVSKIKKGYNPVRTGTVTTTEIITADTVAVLDVLAEQLPEGLSTMVVQAPINAVAQTQAPEADLSQAAAQVLKMTVRSHPVQSTDLVPTLPMRPMLAGQHTEPLHRVIASNTWMAQFKYDGDRVVIEINDGEIRVLNRQGEQKTRNVGTKHLQPFTALHRGRWVFDGEVVGRTLVIFDLAAASDGTHTWVRENTSFGVRYYALQALADLLGLPNAEDNSASSVVLAPIAVGSAEKFTMLQTAQAEQREGIILRSVDAPYEPGRRSMGLIKHKFIKDVDVVVTSLHDTKQSATLSVYETAGQMVEVGAASTIGKGAVQVGDVWEVSFLYVTDPAHPRLFQPRLVAKRYDKSPTECLLDQFANAGTSKIV